MRRARPLSFSRARSAVVAPLVALGVLACAREARAVEHQHHLGLGGGLSMLKVDDKSTMSVGAGFELHYAYGLNDQFNFIAEGTSSIVALNEARGANIPRTRPSAVDSLALGGAYVIDVLRWVPYIGVLGSGYSLGGGSLDHSIIVAGVQVAAGLDYDITRHIAVGFAYRQHMLLSKMDTYPTYSTFFLRAEYVWGF